MIDRETVWYEYDLTSAYTTEMSMAGQPDYEEYLRKTPTELYKLTDEELKDSSLIIHSQF